MNSIITDMYVRKYQSASVGSGNVEEKACAVVPTSSGVSYSIDRTGSRPPHVIFESDQQQQSSADLSDSVTVCDAVTTAETHQDSAVDDVILIEDNCDHDQHVNIDTNTPTSSTTVPVNRHCLDEQKLTVTCVL